MEIIIRDTNAFRNFLDAKNILFRLGLKRTIRSYLILYVLGIFLVLFGLISGQFPANIPGSLGCGVLMVASYFIILSRTAKSKYIERVSRYGKLAYSKNNFKTTIIRDESISFETPVAKSEYKWVIFISYSIYKNFLILNMGESNVESILINRDLMPVDSFQELMDFIRPKMKEKKIR